MFEFRLIVGAAAALALAASPAFTADAHAQSSAAEPETSSAPEQQIATSNPSASIPAVLQASGQFTSLLKAVQATNLSSVLGGPRAITVFAPTDEAFAALPPGVFEALAMPANAATLQKIITYHVIATKVPASQIRGKAAAPVPTANGATVEVGGTGGEIKVGDATVIQADVQASNGVIYVIDKLLLPPGVTLPPPATAGAASPGLASRAAASGLTTPAAPRSTTSSGGPSGTPSPATPAPR